MGVGLSKQGFKRGDTPSISDLHLGLINYVSRSFCIRNLVSKQRRRMLVGGYDLDMTYISDRILAMSFPAEHVRAVFRNPLWQVKSVLDMRHAGHYKVYNLCIEQAYDASHFHGRVERYPIDDNHVPSLDMIKDFCEDVYSWLSSDSKNIVVIHCMAGKGRTGLMVCSYLVYTGMSAEDALRVYAEKRTTNNEGVSIPSQRRYVKYWENALISYTKGVPPTVKLPKSYKRELRRIRLYDTINIESIFFVLSELQRVPGEKYRPSVEVSKSSCRRIKSGIQRTYSPQYVYSLVEENEEEEENKEPRLVVQMDTESSMLYQKTCLDHFYDIPVQISGDVRIIFYEKLIGGRLFYACFNTAFVRNDLLQFSIRELDKVGKKARSITGSSFCLELFFGPANGNCLPTPPLHDDDFSDS
ncbi:phosphatidylinositol 3,4,5-trisphosphate 3-phosphatase and protein-tyrosine-phosphatase PTEN1 [Solanum lycopersicum]|uniref:Phosphatidylinositol-3,4,5-trisphosphate 3-phosphatase n=1 Tax=Solanum lycopersicum TaxID=4081 RepID=A0A3Q7G301_SOLLC|nr:phosphatidylinositol 3,4,5-trisphosphate 3-phosphatase and protein-tyrosine-phosphatase PTEN1 [Solanum lycopersicum]XP_019068433.1 phosphatidylinositol 3,4,5-trisphosphate 3-phosphatase and protein-tyrosine-phosphatase PTEN1 [Solanum lycopersicum]